jgi:5-methylcytosine-specific restriction endonuclease McrA
VKCKTCGKNADNEYCFAHKPRKPLSNGNKLTLSGKKSLSVSSIHQMSVISNKKVKNVQNNKHIMQRDMFMDIWKKRPHMCENCNAHLGSEPLSYMFDHVLEKSKYPDLRYEEENICMLCLDCHSDKTNCKLSNFMKEKIKKVKEIFGK